MKRPTNVIEIKRVQNDKIIEYFVFKRHKTVEPGYNEYSTELKTTKNLLY